MTYDYLIVGAGSAGATLASRLSENPNARVLLLEAGPDWRSHEAPAAMRSPNPAHILMAPEHVQYRWRSLAAKRTQTQAARPFWRGCGLGGSSTVNGQIAIRGIPEDYDEWAQAGCEGWSFQDVLPAFNKLETDLRYGEADYHGNDGPTPIYRAPLNQWGPVDQALAEAGLDADYHWAPDHNAPGALGVSPYAINSRDQARVTTNDAYLDPWRDRPNLTIQCEAHVDQVLFDHKQAIGVNCLVDEYMREYHADKVILAAGAIHSPTILMRSGIGPADQLKEFSITINANLCVGEQLQDHPMIGIFPLLKPHATSSHDARHTNCCIRYSSELEGAGPGDMMIVSMNLTGTGQPQESKAGAPQFGMLAVWVNQCFSRGSVQLASPDPFAEPIIEENMLSDARDLNRLRDGFRRLIELSEGAAVQDIAHKVLASPAGHRLDALSTDATINDWVLHHASDAQHASSTCRMGHPDHEDTVVDPNCQVLGVSNLYVIDASVMPSVPRANTHLSVVMIAEHMAMRFAAGQA